MPEDFQRCVTCRERIEKINFATSVKWMHWPSPYGNYRTSEKYEYCRGSRATPEPARCVKCGGPAPFHDPACIVHPGSTESVSDQTNRNQEES